MPIINQIREDLQHENLAKLARSASSEAVNVSRDTLKKFRDNKVMLRADRLVAVANALGYTVELTRCSVDPIEVCGWVITQADDLFLARVNSLVQPFFSIEDAQKFCESNPM
jgi:hypothetical protein